MFYRRQRSKGECFSVLKIICATSGHHFTWRAEGGLLSSSAALDHGAVTIRRVVPNLSCQRMQDTRAFYEGVVGFEVAMDLGWIVTLASPDNETAQISLSEGSGEPGDDHPVLTIEVSDVDAINRRALAGQHEITMTLRDEEWGVRRFFIRDPDGRVVNIMGHPAVSG